MRIRQWWGERLNKSKAVFCRLGLRIKQAVIRRRQLARQAALIAGSAIFLIIALFLAYSAVFTDRAYPRIRVGEVAVGGKTANQIDRLLDNQLANRGQRQIVLRHESQEWTLAVAAIKLTYNKKETNDGIFAIGREKSLARRLWGRIEPIVRERSVDPAYNFDQTELDKFLGNIVKSLDTPEKNASVTIADGQASTKESKQGLRVEQQQLRERVLGALNRWQDDEVIVPVTVLEPVIKIDQAKIAQDEAGRMLASELTLKWEKGDWSVGADTIGKWLEVITIEPPKGGGLVILPANSDQANKYRLQARINDDRLKIYVDWLAQQIDKTPKDARLAIVDGKVSALQISEDGYELDQPATINELKRMVGLGEKGELALPVKVLKPEVSVDALDNLGIKEIIGTATTTFAGSPDNRMHNIANGASFLHGALVKPGEEFSVVKTLGKIDGSTGYLPELVIKENKTIPEYGGGLCQVSTTLFRAALNAGVKISERRNHSYRVSYYEKDGAGNYIGPGLDATIYLPHPDLRFVNDTASYILVQGKVEETTITFDLWGTKDGRESKVEGPFVTDVTPPPPAQYVPSDTLLKGQTKLVEKAHEGATAVAYYTVIKDGKELHKMTFNSKYKAWPARYLVGTKE